MVLRRASRAGIQGISGGVDESLKNLSRCTARVSIFRFSLFQDVRRTAVFRTLPPALIALKKIRSTPEVLKYHRVYACPPARRPVPD